MLGKILYEKYEDRTGKGLDSHHFLVTDKMDIWCSFGGKEQNPRQDITFHHDNLPDSFTHDGIEGLRYRVHCLQDNFALDRIYLFGEGNDGRRLDDEIAQNLGISLGCLYGEYSDADLFSAVDGKSWLTIVKEINSSIIDYRRRGGDVLLQRTKRNLQTDPYTPENFFQPRFGGIGPVYKEIFKVICGVEDTSDGCDDYSQEQRLDFPGFSITATTRHFEYEFEYHSSHGLPRFFTSNRFMIRDTPGQKFRGYLLQLDEKLKPIYAYTYCNSGGFEDVDKESASQKEFILSKMTPLWEEFYKEFQIERRVEECKSLTSDQVRHAMDLACYFAVPNPRDERPIRHERRAPGKLFEP